MKKIVVNMTTILVLFLLLGTLTGCTEKTEASNTKENIFIQPKEVVAEYKKTASTLTFPEGFTLENPILEEGDYQKGFGETMAYQTWQMAWEKEWLKTYKNQPEKGNFALEELEKALYYPYMGPEKCDDATRRFFKDALTKAKAGDPTGFAEDVKVNG